jgi:hypothetical protein
MKAIGINIEGEARNLGRMILIGAVLTLMTIIIYLPALDSLMVADDFLIVGRLDINHAIRSLHDTVGFGRNEHRPVIAFSYVLSNWIWHGALRGYHFDNVLLHSINVILLFWWILLLTRSTLISGMAAVIFAVHPIAVERVAWITSRDCIVSTLFLLLTLIAYTLARCKIESESKIFKSLSVFFFVLSLLSYEGSVVLPGLLVALESLIFAQPGQECRKRLQTAFVKTRWHIITLIIYLAWWIFLFRGEIGQYNESYALGNVLHNYYSLLYQLFHGNARIAGVLYFGLLFTFFLMRREHRQLAVFALLCTLLAFIPFIFSTGFAPRFAYSCAIGYATLIALMIYSCGALKNARAGFGLAALIFLVLAGYYTTALRTRLSDWVIAGQIADGIPRQITALHPDMPSGATLILARIPQMYGHAYVYPLGLDAAIKRFYPGRDLHVIYGPGEIDGIADKVKPQGPHTFYFIYDAAHKRIEEIASADSE